MSTLISSSSSSAKAEAAQGKLIKGQKANVCTVVAAAVCVESH